MSGELKDEGVNAGRFLVSRVMREEGLVAKGPRPFKPRTTDSRHTKMASPNLLKDVENTAFGAGEVLVGDITYLPLAGGGFCYLAMFQDVRTKRIVGWSVSTRMTATLVTQALAMALRRGLIKRNAIIHTDRGSQYASTEFRQLLKRCRIRQSMSGKATATTTPRPRAFSQDSRPRPGRRSSPQPNTHEAKHSTWLGKFDAPTSERGIERFRIGADVAGDYRIEVFTTSELAGIHH